MRVEFHCRSTLAAPARYCMIGSVLGDPLAFLRQHPAFANMRRMVQQNPNSLAQLMQQIGQNNPRLLQVRESSTVPCA